MSYGASTTAGRIWSRLSNRLIWTRRISEKYHIERTGCLLSFAQWRETVLCWSALEAVSVNPLNADVDVGFGGARKRLTAADRLL
jgi:hypothetical protein